MWHTADARGCTQYLQLAFGDVQSRYLVSYSNCEPYQNFGDPPRASPILFPRTRWFSRNQRRPSRNRPPRRSGCRITRLRATEHHIARVLFIKYNIFLRSGSKFRLRNRPASRYIPAKASIPTNCEENMIHGQVTRHDHFGSFLLPRAISC